MQQLMREHQPEWQLRTAQHLRRQSAARRALVERALDAVVVALHETLQGGNRINVWSILSLALATSESCGSSADRASQSRHADAAAMVERTLTCRHLAELQVEKQRLADQAPDSDAIAFLTASTAAYAPAASTAGRGATAAAAGVAATQQRTAADADAAMAALLVGAPTMHITALVPSLPHVGGAHRAHCHGIYTSARTAQLALSSPT